MSKLRLWNSHQNWEAAEKEWDEKAKAAEAKEPIRKLSQLPQMPGITADTAKSLKWKSLKWMVKYDQGLRIFRHFLRHPIKYGLSLLSSYRMEKPFKRDGDFFLYGIDKAEELLERLKNPKSLLIVGFSYCHKPFECPSGRFTPDCIHDPENNVCKQCFIGKTVHALPEQRTLPLIIPTIHYIGNEIFKTVHANPDKEVLFLITACEMTLQMFGDWGNMVGIKGIGVRLDGRICNTMKAFELSEKGIKPGLTVVLDATQTRILDLIRAYRETFLK